MAKPNTLASPFSEIQLLALYGNYLSVLRKEMPYEKADRADERGLAGWLAGRLPPTADVLESAQTSSGSFFSGLRGKFTRANGSISQTVCCLISVARKTQGAIPHTQPTPCCSCHAGYLHNGMHRCAIRLGEGLKTKSSLVPMDSK